MILNKTLRYLLLLGIFSITLVPLFVASSMYFPFITGKNFAFRIVVEIMLGLWLILIYRDRRFLPKKSWVVVSLSLYLLMATLATIFGENPARSFWSNFERMEGLLAYIHNYLFFIIAVSVMKSREIWRWLLSSTVFISVIISIYALFQFLGKLDIHQGSTRLDATLGNAAYLANYLLFHIFILVYLFFTTSVKNKMLRWFYVILGIFELAILYFTATRGAILGLIGGVFLLLLLTAWKRTGRSRKISLIILGVLSLGVGVFWLMRATPFVVNSPVLGRFASISLTETTTQSRFLIWNMSLQGFKEHPVLGWGPENYPLIFQKYYVPEMWKQEPWFDRSHNVVFDNLVNFGLLGLLAYLSIFFTAIYYLWKGNRNENDQGWFARLIIICLLSAYFFQNIFVFDNLTSVILFYIILGYVHTVYGKEELTKKEESIAEPKKHSKHTKDSEGAFLPIVVIVAVIISAFSVYYFSWRSINISQTLIQAISSGTTESKLSSFNKIFSYGLATGQVEAREQLISITRSVVANKDVSNEMKEKFAVLTQKEIGKQLIISPDDARMRLFYGSFLSNLGQTESAIRELTIASQLSPKKQMILFELGSLLINNDKKTEALALFKQAFEEDETYTEARKMYALVLLYVGDSKLADEVLGSNFAEYINDDRFLNYYLNSKQYDKVISIWQTRIKNSPKDKQPVISLAGMYYSIGQKNKAIQTIEDFIKLDPTFFVEGQDLIKKIQTGQIK